jgi:hypothetical protein
LKLSTIGDEVDNAPIPPIAVACAGAREAKGASVRESRLKVNRDLRKVIMGILVRGL